MAIKRIRSKRKNHVTEISDMERLFLFRDVREYLDDGVPLSANNLHILRELRTTPEEFTAKWLLDAGEHQQQTFRRWVEDAALSYRESPNATTRERLIEALKRVGMNVEEYLHNNFEKYQPVSLKSINKGKSPLRNDSERLKRAGNMFVWVNNSPSFYF